MGLTANTARDFRSRVLLVSTVCLLSVLAWIALWRFGSSAHLLHHPGHQQGPLATTFFWFFVLGWAVMAVAMMLPSSVPLFLRFHQVSAGRRDRTLLVSAVIAGYLAVWVLFGAVVYAGATAATRFLDTLPAVVNNQWLIGGFTLSIAGAFQFTRLKHQCLDICKSPSAFITRHWCGVGRFWKALRLGAFYGVLCIGCCWALMLLMFLVSVGNVAWMLVLATIMAVEKSPLTGRRLSAAIGIVLLGTGTVLLALGIGSSFYGG